MKSEKSPLQNSTLRQRVPLVGKGFPSCWGCDLCRRQGEHHRGRCGGRRPGPRGGAAVGHGRCPSSPTSPAFPTQPGRRRAQRQRRRLLRALPHLAESRAAPPTPAAAPAPLQPGTGICGRGRAGNFAAAGGAAPPGARTSVRVAGGLLGAAAERGTRGKVSSAPGSRGGGDPRGAGCRDPNSGGAAPRTRPSGAAAGRASGLRVLLPGRAAAAAFALGRAAAAAAASPARAGPLSAGAGSCSREGGSGRPGRARSGASAGRHWPCPERRVRVSNNGAKRRREPRVRPAVVEEVAGLRVGWAGRRPPVTRSPEFALRAGPLRPRAPLQITDGSSSRRVWCQRPG